MRRSPLHALHAARSPEFVGIADMLVPARYGDEPVQPRAALSDVSHLVRVGLKGSGAAAWLAEQGVPLPERANTWVAAPDGALTARLGETEFLLENTNGPGPAGAVAQALIRPPANVYPVLRQDAALLLWGEHANEVLLETCSLDFREVSADRGELVLTSMVGVSVLIVPTKGSLPAYRVFADPSLGPYLWETLLEIVEFHGGGAAGLTQVDARRLLAMC